MRSIALAAFLFIAQASCALACDCMAKPADSTAGTYRAITALLCLLPLAMSFGLVRWLGKRMREVEEADVDMSVVKPDGLVVVRVPSRGQQPLA